MHPVGKLAYRLLLAALATALLAALGAIGTAGAAADSKLRSGAVYAMTNDAAGNQVLAYSRSADGTLAL